MINIMSTDKCFDIWEILAQGPNSSIICTRCIQGYCSSTSSFCTNFMEDLVTSMKHVNIHPKIKPFSQLIILYLSTASVSKIHRKIQGTSNCHSITETMEISIQQNYKFAPSSYSIFYILYNTHGHLQYYYTRTRVGVIFPQRVIASKCPSRSLLWTF